MEVQRDFCLELSEGFIYDCIKSRVAELDCAEYRRWTLAHFSGTLCIDELHLGKHTLLLATDPIGDFLVAFALVDSHDAEHMRRFLANLKSYGFEPRVVINDGSLLSPKLLAEVWPDAEHQLCVFHVLQDINRHVLDAVKRLRRAMKRRGQRGRRRGRGRPRRTEAGGIVLPAMPGLYHQPLTIMDLIDFVVTRICDRLGRPVQLTRRWGVTESESPRGE